MSERPYSRVYWSILDDPKFDGIRDDTRLLGSWLLLLIVAEMSYPAPSFIPPMVGKAALDRLVQADIIEVLSGRRFRVVGLAAERERRSEIGRAGGIASGRSRAPERTFNERSTIVDIDEQSKAKQSKDEQRRAKQSARENGLKRPGMERIGDVLGRTQVR